MTLRDWSCEPRLQTLRDAAHGLTPAFLIGGFMSALVPLLLARRRLGGARNVFEAAGLTQIVAVAMVLAAESTTPALALIHAAASLLEVHELGPNAMLRLRAGEAALAASVVTPLALAMLTPMRAHYGNRAA